MRIRRLSKSTINRIAAGEVVERPASAVKELVENAIDAGATQVDVVFRGGGKSLIRVTDNGFGMSAEDLALAVERHATSKIPDDDLVHIATLGFRGEALPSIGSVARLAITSVARGSIDAHLIAVEGGTLGAIAPASLRSGTEVEVRDLFYATPARLKFLKTDRSENSEALDVIRRLALAHSAIGFSFVTEEREWLRAPPGESREARVARIMGRDFISNAIALDGGAEDVRVEGFAGLPTFQRAQGTLQYAVVNGRPVKDKLVAGAIRGAYADVMPRGRFPAVVLYITCDDSRVDVNVHPAKTEVRFRDPGFVRGLIVSTIRRALAGQGMKPDTTASRATAQAFSPVSNAPRWQPRWTPPSRPANGGFAEAAQAALAMNMPLQSAVDETSEDVPLEFPLGVARAQLHGNYIVAQTTLGMILVDQHAAHERIVYERLKRERESQGITTQTLLVPQVIDLDPATLAEVLGLRDLLAQGGLLVESFGEGAVLVREVPAALSGGNVPALLRDIADDAAELDALATIDARLNHVLATFACHHSVRSGRALRPEEMNALLREMEKTPNAAQCNHGRPTFIELKLSDIERLFGRS
jgi:DNA mismatch repair protein MutL